MWYSITFSKYPDGDFGDGWIWQMGPNDERLEPPARLTADQIGSNVDGAGTKLSSLPTGGE